MDSLLPVKIEKLSVKKGLPFKMFDQKNFQTQILTSCPLFFSGHTLIILYLKKKKNSDLKNTKTSNDFKLTPLE